MENNRQIINREVAKIKGVHGLLMGCDPKKVDPMLLPDFLSIIRDSTEAIKKVV